MDSRADDKVKKMFTVLCDNISQQMWERTVIVLTFANMFLQLGNIRQLQTTEGKVEFMKREIDEFRSHVYRYVQGSITDDMFKVIPFCVAGLEDERELLPGTNTNDWLVSLWECCLSRSSDEACNFLTRFGQFRLVFEKSAVGGGALTGGAVGGAIGGTLQERERELQEERREKEQVRTRLQQQLQEKDRQITDKDQRLTEAQRHLLSKEREYQERERQLQQSREEYQQLQRQLQQEQQQGQERERQLQEATRKKEWNFQQQLK